MSRDESSTTTAPLDAHPNLISEAYSYATLVPLMPWLLMVLLLHLQKLLEVLRLDEVLFVHIDDGWCWRYFSSA